MWIVQYLQKHFAFSGIDWMNYATLFRRVEVPSKTTLLQEGKISKKIYFIEKGCIRVWLNKDGKDITFQFFMEGDRVSSTESLQKNIPSIVSIETIEDAVLWVINKTDMDHIMKQAFDIPQLRFKLLDALYNRQIHYMKHCIAFITDSPQQRYANLLAEHPEIVQRVPQRYIASYLGITTVHLSRIKNKLMSVRVKKNN